MILWCWYQILNDKAIYLFYLIELTQVEWKIKSFFVETYLWICNNDILPNSGIFINYALSAKQNRSCSKRQQET